MNNTHRENGTMAGPLIFTVPAYGFVMALYLGCLGRDSVGYPGSHEEVHHSRRIPQRYPGEQCTSEGQTTQFKQLRTPLSTKGP